MPLVTVSARSTLPDRIVLYGVEGVGKTTWAASAPAPVFLLPEDGVRNLDVPKLMASDGGPLVTYNDVLESLCSLMTEPHDFKTFIVDTADWLEPLIRQHVIATHCDGDESKYEAFGRGISFSMSYWKALFSVGGTLDQLRTRRGMEIIILAHAQLKADESPSLGTEVKRYGLKIPGTKNCQPSSIITEWADTVLFATFEEVRKTEGDKVKASPTGRRVVKTVRGMMWEAKSRWKIPAELPLSYDAYAKARGVLSRLPEFRDQARAHLARLVAHPSYKEMDAEVTKAWDNEAALGGVVQSLAAAVEPESF